MQEKTEESTHSSSVPTLSTSIPGDSVTMSSHLHQSSNWPHQCKYKKKKKKKTYMTHYQLLRSQETICHKI